MRMKDVFVGNLHCLFGRRSCRLVYSIDQWLTMIVIAVVLLLVVRISSSIPAVSARHVLSEQNILERRTSLARLIDPFSLTFADLLKNGASMFPCPSVSVSLGCSPVSSRSGVMSWSLLLILLKLFSVAEQHLTKASCINDRNLEKVAFRVDRDGIVKTYSDWMCNSWP